MMQRLFIVCNVGAVLYLQYTDPNSTLIGHGKLSNQHNLHSSRGDLTVFLCPRKGTYNNNLHFIELPTRRAPHLPYQDYARRLS